MKKGKIKLVELNIANINVKRYTLIYYTSLKKTKETSHSAHYARSLNIRGSLYDTSFFRPPSLKGILPLGICYGQGSPRPTGG